MSDRTVDENIDRETVADEEFIRLVSHRSTGLLGVMQALSASDSPIDLINGWTRFMRVTTISHDSTSSMYS